MSMQAFCLRCDSILPLEITGNAVICRLCNLAHSYTDMLNKEIHSTVIFNTRDIADEVFTIKLLFTVLTHHINIPYFILINLLFIYYMFWFLVVFRRALYKQFLADLNVLHSRSIFIVLLCKLDSNSNSTTSSNLTDMMRGEVEIGSTKSHRQHF